MEQARFDWDTNPAKPRAEHDKEGIQRIRAAGAPISLGIGFGERQAKASKTCMFGARIQFKPTIMLNELAVEMERLAVLTRDLAAIEHPPSAED